VADQPFLLTINGDTYTRHFSKRWGGFYIRRTTDGAYTAPYVTLQAAIRAAERGQLRASSPATGASYDQR
jgi:hypothetical protein